MNIYTYILTIFFSFILYFQVCSQNLTDSISIPKSEQKIEDEVEEFYPPECDSIKGSGIKINSKLNKESKEKGYDLVYFDMMPCDLKTNVEDFKRRISYKKIQNDTLTIDVATTATCCIDVIAQLEVLKGDTLNLIFESCGEGCFCFCCYTLRYQIVIKNKPKDIHFQLNGRRIEESPNQYIQRRQEVDTLKDGTIRVEFFEDDILTIEKSRHPISKNSSFRKYIDGILYSENLHTKTDEITRIYVASVLVKETLVDKTNNTTITRKYSNGVLINEEKGEWKKEK